MLQILNKKNSRMVHFFDIFLYQHMSLVTFHEETLPFYKICRRRFENKDFVG